MARPKQTVDSTPESSNETGWPEWADAIAVAQLRNALRSGTIGHAYLFAGPKGVGKAVLARAFAQAVCCSNLNERDPSEPCGHCRSCRNVARGAHPDVERIDLEAQLHLAEKPGRGANLSIETMRRLRATASLLPLEASRRMLIVDDAETLLEPAQQALLKILEEPPPFVTIILLADEAEALLETVRSRCQLVAVRPVAIGVIEDALRNRGVSSELAREIAELSRGCPAWAMAAAEGRSELQLSRQARETAQSWIEAAPYERLVTAYRLGEQYTKRRGEVIGVVQAAIHVMREEMIGAVDQPREQDPGRLQDKMSRTALAWSQGIDAALRCLGDLEANVRPRLALQAMVLAWPNSESLAS
jgi:DNA polymerase-3 subunit delta'